MFLVLPTLLVIVGAFEDPSGGVSVANFAVLAEKNTLDAFLTSFAVSISSALIGTIIGALAAGALVIGSPTSSLLRRVVTSLSSVLAQFGGVMLAFAFIATIGQTGIVTVVLRNAFGIELDPTWLSSLPGLVLVYCYFQIPLMIIVFVPALDSLQPQWREATEVLGGSAWTYWREVAGPILFRPVIASFLLLFANAFSSFATAAALFSQRSILVPLLIQSALRNELDTNLGGQAAVLAVTHQWTLSTWQTLFGGAESGSGTDLSLLWEGVRNSLGMSLLTVVLMLLLLVPAMVIARMGHSRLSKALEFLCLMPLAIPAIALVVGLGPIYRVISTNLLNSNSIWLSFAYVILVLPFAYRAIDAGLSELNVMVLFEAATSLGSSWIRTLLTVIIPNIRTAILSACFVSIAVVLGEYTIAAILGRTNLQAALFIINQSDSFVAAAMSLLAILFAILLLVAIDIVSAVKQRKVHS